jgi:tetratricopeptide (TPR) repeat protein
VPGVPAPAVPAAPVAPPSRFRPDEPVDALAAKYAQFPDDVALGLGYQDALLRDGRRGEAEAIFNRRHDATPADPVATILWARLKGGADGRVAVQGALKNQATFPEAYQVLSEIEEADEMWDAAKAAVDLLTKQRGSARDWLWAGYVRERAGDLPGATTAYAKAVELDPTQWAAKLGQAFVLLDEDKAKEAVALLDGEKNPPSAEALWPLAKAIAYKTLEETLPDPKTGPDPKADKGAGSKSAGDKGGGDKGAGDKGAAEGPSATELKAAAREALDAGFKLAMKDRPTLLGAVSVAIRVKLAAAAQAVVDGILAKDPLDPDFLAARAVLGIEAKAYPAALGDLAEAMKKLPKDPRLKFLAGIAELHSNHNDKALGFFKAAAEIDPLNARYALGIAHALDRKGSKDVLAAWRHAAELDPKDPEPHVDAGLYLYAKGKYEDATAEFEIASKLAPTEPLFHYYLAIMHGDRLGMLGIALDHLREYKRLGGTDEAVLSWLAGLESMGN